MIYYVFLVALAAGALALPSLPNTDKSTQTGDYVPISDICIFGFPTFHCKAKCEKLGQEVYCDNQKCLCRPEQKPGNQEHHETQQESSVPTTDLAATTTLPEHNADGAAVAAKPTEEEPPIKCFMGLYTVACESRCSQRGLQAHCENRMDGQFCVCGDRKDIQPQTNTNTALTLYHSTDETPLMCYMGRKPLMCVLRCQQRDLESYCNERNLCVCSENLLEPVSFNDDLNDEPDDDDDEEESSPNVFMYFMKWTKLFGDDNDTETTVSPTSGSQEPPSRVYYMHEESSWNYEYLLTLLVLGLLSILILMELLTCLKRKKNRSKVDNIFQTMPATPNKS